MRVHTANDRAWAAYGRYLRVGVVGSLTWAGKEAYMTSVTSPSLPSAAADDDVQLRVEHVILVRPRAV